ncbi:LysE family translocator [Streptomyces sp. NBC_01538]|jgi:threonine/homoserine/homoserine lactone efflux protein|uniref:LysE family translocator n=1 Tax=Streptomyces sp. NBC_01538 TaxID=2903897 RepID=UPI00386ACDAC
MTTALWSFVLVVGLLTLTPGVDSALILRTAALGSRRRAWGVVLGIQTGTLLWGFLTSLGLTALLTASRLAYETLRWLGVAYLLWLGGRILWHSLRRTGTQVDNSAPQSAAEDDLLQGWRQGTLTNLLNPKMGVFYAAVLPQFIPAGAPHLATGVLLACVHILLGLIWSTALIGFARALRDWFQRPAARRLLDRITGTVLVAFGLRLAVAD